VNKMQRLSAREDRIIFVRPAKRTISFPDGLVPLDIVKRQMPRTAGDHYIRVTLTLKEKPVRMSSTRYRDSTVMLNISSGLDSLLT
jgi:hypothetical protein